MDRLSTPSPPQEGFVLTAKMMREFPKLLQEAQERSEKTQDEYNDVLRPLLGRLKSDDYDGLLAVVKLVQSGFYQPLHPDDAEWCLEIVRSRGFKEFDRE